MMEEVGNYYVVFRPESEIVVPKTLRTKKRLERFGQPAYLKKFIARKRRYNGWVYLIHFDKPYKHAKHYLGFTRDIPLRELRHRAGNGANIMRVVNEAGIGWKVVRVWYGDRYLERKLKAHSGTRYCPICKGAENEAKRKREIRAAASQRNSKGNQTTLSDGFDVFGQDAA